MTDSPFRYRNIFLYASLQFSGNIEEYFSRHTEKLVVFIVMPRVENKFNLVRFYKHGVLEKEIKVRSSNNIFLYYLLWYVQYFSALMKFFKKNDKVVVIAFHPLSFFLMSIQRHIIKLEYVYWIGDYFPGVNLPLRLYEKMKKFYHDRIPYSLYLSNKINEKMNGKVINSINKKTVMWGVKPRNLVKETSNDKIKILFVGLIKPSQGIENVLYFLKKHKEYHIKILGICERKFYKKLNKLIKRYRISNQVYFPNIFLSDEDLEKESNDCHVGLALYDSNPLNATFYADPGKVKLYAELKLPIIMTNISDTAGFIKRFGCGEIVNRPEDLEKALIKIKIHYKKYQQGLKKFNEYFYYESYYKSSFHFLENYGK